MDDSFIDIGTDRLCDCSEKHLCCLTAKEWMKSQIGIWEFFYEKRDIRNKKLHPATFPISLAQKVISLFTHEGELVIDPFVGSGTTLVAAKDLNRNAVGFDLKQEYVDLANLRIEQEQKEESNTNQFAICEDARKIAEHIKPNSVQLILTSPPYANLLNRKRKNKSRRSDTRKNDQYDQIEQYSQDERDLGTLEAQEFEDALCEIYHELKPLLREKGHVIVNITDGWMNNKRIPLHINVINALTRAGFEFRNTIIWDRRNIVNGVGIFGWPSNYITMGATFEYILDFTLPIEPKTTKEKKTNKAISEEV